MSLPSLLVQAAQSAAIADGLVPPPSTNETTANDENNTNATSNKSAGAVATDASQVMKSGITTNNTPGATTTNNVNTSANTTSSTIASNSSNSTSNQSAVEAALAMVASGNSKVEVNKAQVVGDNKGNGGPASTNTKLPSLNGANDSEKSSQGPTTGTLSSNGQQQQQQLAVPKSAGSAAHMLAMAASTHGKPSSLSNTTSTNVPSINSNSSTTPNPTASVNIAPQAPKPTTLAPPLSASSSSTSPHPPQIASSNGGAAAIGGAGVRSNSTTPSTTASTTTSVAANTTTSSSSGGGKKKGPPLRRGKWTAEEEAYANRLILEFKAGLLPLTDGTTLRTFLSKLLNCDPMRISKKFVGSNCIGKQVFRRRTADINRLTPEQIQQSRAELSELERRFLDRVAQTNRVKSSGVGSNSGGSSSQTTASVAEVSKVKEDVAHAAPPSPPWLRPPDGFKHGTGAATAAKSLSSGTVNRTAMIGRAMLEGNSSRKSHSSSKPSLNSSGSTGLLALMELQNRQSRQNLLAETLGGGSNGNLLAGAVQNGGGNNNNSLSGPALAQIARNASAARMAGLAASGNSMTNLMMNTGLSRDQLSQLVKDRHSSSNSLSNMMGGRQSSLDALMSLDFQSMQSIDNLANLIQTGANSGSRVPKSGMKNWSSDGNSSSNLAAVAASLTGSNNNMQNLSNFRRLASENRMESLIRSLSSNNVANKSSNSGGSNANFNDLLQSMQNNSNGQGNQSASDFLGQAASALNLADMLRTNSSTGLTALRLQDGLAQRNTSVDDFLSLVANGDIPHQDPHMLNVPLQTVLQQSQKSGASAAAQYLAQQQLLAQAAGNNNSSLSQRIASLGGLGNSSAASLLSQYTQQQQSQQQNQSQQQSGPNSNDSNAASLLQQQQHARLLAAASQQQNTANPLESLESLKRKFSLTDLVKDADSQGPSKR